MPPKKASGAKKEAPKPSTKKSKPAPSRTTEGAEKDSNTNLLGRLMPLLNAPVLNQGGGEAKLGFQKPQQPSNNLFPGDDLVFDEEQPSRKTTTASGNNKVPSPKRGRKKQPENSQSAFQVEWTQLFQSLCLSVRLELSHRRRGETCRLSKSLVVLDEEFLTQLRSLYFGGGVSSTTTGGRRPEAPQQPTTATITIAHLIDLQARLPSKLVVHQPNDIISQHAPTTTTTTTGGLGEQLDPSAVMVDHYSLHLNVDMVPSLDEVATWLQQQEMASGSSANAPIQRSKRGREDDPSTASVVPTGGPSLASAIQPRVPTFGNFPKHIPKPAVSSTTAGGDRPVSGTGPGDLAKYLSQEKLAAVLESKKTAVEAEQERVSAELQQDYERLLPLYDRVLSIIGPSRRCYALSRLTLELQSLGRAGGGVGSASNNQPSDILRQLRILVTFKDSGMEEVQPKRLFIGGDGESSEDGMGGTAASSEDNTAVSGPGLLVLDITKCHRLRLSAAIERRKDELGF